MQREALALAAALFALLPEARAETAVAGGGTFSCGQFANYYRANPKLTEELFFAWAQGWMSAMNLESLNRDRTSQNLSSISTEQQQRFLRSYCNEHPLAEYMDGVFDLYKSLKPNAPVPRNK